MARIATRWAPAGHSWPLAALPVVVPVGPPTVFAVPGDKARVIVPVPGAVTLALVLLQLGAAVNSSWAVWPAPVAAPAGTVAAATVMAGIPRRRWPTGNGFGPGADTP
ncbi:hypothetical protein ACFW3D_39365 [Streptomyces sp. NPDC058864]